MAKRRPVEAKPEGALPEAGFYRIDGDDKDAISKASADALDQFSTVASRYNDFSDLAPNVSGRPGFDRSHYDYFRPSEATPKKLHEIITLADNIYQRVGLVRNVIDLMGDFACQGIRLSHPVKSIERFYQKWFESVSGVERSERFLNNLYRTANVVVRKSTHRASIKDVRKMKRAKGEPDSDRPDEDVIVTREIPNKYVFLNPNTVEIIGGSLASFVGIKRYAIKIPTNVKRLIQSPSNELEKQIVSQLPEDVKAAAKSNKPYPLPEDKTLVYHYKKDDWLPWAYPMIHAIMDDIFMLDKLRLADLTALDGAITNTRIYRLGNIDAGIAPTRAAASKLSDMLQNNVAGGMREIIWGPDIDILETKNNGHEILGEEKYKSTYSAIYAGLGIPPTLTGTFGAAGTTNNFISLKTLVERLQYGRSVLMAFWNHEVRLIQKSFKFANPPIVEFDHMNLANEEAMLALYIQLADRNVISDETLSKIFKHHFDLETVRLNRETRERKSGRRTKKLGPYENIEEALKKIALQSGQVVPSQVGLELDEKEKGQVPLIDKQMALKKQQQAGKPIPKKKGRSGQGRPKGKKDTTKRKVKKFTPKAKALLETWAGSAQESIADIVNPLILDMYDRKNFRQLTEAETLESEELKRCILFNIGAFASITEESVNEALKKPMPAKANELTKYWYKALAERLGREPTFSEIHQLNTSIYATYIEELHGED
jgi:hypothetical protein